ncbi:peptidoglycan-binding protein [Streptomyces sp. NPDC051907]|uniref:peptidoglycan-binding protein n=1 Tax=Streptomyces sp. NPDC051907 TaxID=3155284 RepID=UPI0034248A85
MTVPVFEEYEPAADCDCPGCAQRRRALAAGDHPSAQGCRRALVAFTAAGLALTSGGAAQAVAPTVGLPADVAAPAVGVSASASAESGGGPAAGAATEPAVGADPGPGAGGATAPAAGAAAEPAAGPAMRPAAGAGIASGADGADPVADGVDPAADPAADPDHEPVTEQGGRSPLHGPPASGQAPPPPATVPLRKLTRAQILARAKTWIDAEVPYSMSKYWSDGYRQDCSGYVSMAWHLAANEWTGSLAQFGTRILREELEPGDMLLFHNPANPTTGSHVVLFGGWTDYTHTYYTAYEQAPPSARKQTTPMAYWNNSASYVAYRYKGLDTTTGGGEAVAPTPFPGAASFGPGTDNKYVKELGQMLIERGGGRFYPAGASTRWSEADRLATEAFQLAQGWEGTDADGLPGAETWRLLTNKLGKDIPPLPGAKGPGGADATPATPKTPVFPGRGHFRPGQSNAHIAQLGRQLVKRGFGKHYASGPGSSWGEADRRNVEAFQRAQGWRGGDADGYPDPETWRRLFLD